MDLEGGRIDTVVGIAVLAGSRNVLFARGAWHLVINLPYPSTYYLNPEVSLQSSIGALH